MILTCHRCPKQISFPGSKRNFYARLFGWIVRGGALFLRPFVR